MPEWAAAPPSMMDIVTAYYPETKPKGDLRLRPCLVTAVYVDEDTQEFLCDVAYGTTNLKAWVRMGKDVIIQNISDLDSVGLPRATRFNLDIKDRVRLVWGDRDFGCWTGNSSPRIGTLTDHYQREYAFCMMKQMSEQQE
jgi:hypothetical protein